MAAQSEQLSMIQETQREELDLLKAIAGSAVERAEGGTAAELDQGGQGCGARRRRGRHCSASWRMSALPCSWDIDLRKAAGPTRKPPKPLLRERLRPPNGFRSATNLTL